MDFLYQRALKPLLFKCNPEVMHDLFVTVGEFSGRFWVLRKLFALIYNYRGPDISKTVDGITYRTPVLLSAGFDPDGQLTQILPSLSFSGEEIGSTTAHPCEGNPRPRLTRLIRNKSLVVWKGLRNKGVDTLIAKLRRTPRAPHYVLGISIARTNEEASATDAEAGIRDYVESFKKLAAADIGDFARLMPRLMEVPHTQPVYIKMPINIPWEQFSALLDTADRNGVQGVIIGNLNKDYSHLNHPEDAPKEFRGGLSGMPTFKLSNDLIRKTREKYGERFTIIGTGGIFSAEDAMTAIVTFRISAAAPRSLPVRSTLHCRPLKAGAARCCCP
jgi:dihydroorotate dehydrogenase